MSAESAVGAGILYKLGLAVGFGLIGAAIMAAFDPPKTRREMFTQAAVAAVGSFVFGELTHLAIASVVTFATPAQLVIPAYFLTGALSWGAFGALAAFRRLVARKGAKFLSDKVGLK